MSTQLNLAIGNRSVPIPKGMLGAQAVPLVAKQLGRDPDGLVLRRVTDGVILDTDHDQPVADVFADGDIVELAERRDGEP
jgi:hypothetical protein